MVGLVGVGCDRGRSLLVSTVRTIAIGITTAMNKKACRRSRLIRLIVFGLAPTNLNRPERRQSEELGATKGRLFAAALRLAHFLVVFPSIVAGGEPLVPPIEIRFGFGCSGFGTRISRTPLV